jgi:hypothetical protein
MNEEPATATSSDITTDPVWVNEQIDRLLGWELLRRELMCDVTPVETMELCDSIGVNKGYVHTVLQSVKPKFESFNPSI